MGCSPEQQYILGNSCPYRILGTNGCNSPQIRKYLPIFIKDNQVICPTFKKPISEIGDECSGIVGLCVDSNTLIKIESPSLIQQPAQKVGQLEKEVNLPNSRKPEFGRTTPDVQSGTASTT